ncbi:MAG: capsular polysaccharide biosynthesis protein [Plesiomonas sp.]|uniref:capsular polysaccharide biosynthesis protein n=1 Tax=Plesiomonas sp. TaxID=2486279 RepID=UPI003F3572EF
MLGTLSRGIRRIPHIAQFVEHDVRYVLHPHFAPPKSMSAILVWGYRPSAVRGERYAMQHQLPLWRLEDGFLRSVGLGVQGCPPLSVVIDRNSMYYHAHQPSLLETLIIDEVQHPKNRPEAAKALALITTLRLSKYNHAPDFIMPTSPQRPVVLVIDQTFGDMALQYAEANQHHFTEMLNAAISENPDADIWVKVHPDVLCGKKQGYLAELTKYHAKRDARVQLVAQEVNPLSLIAVACKVYAVTSHMGFEALMAGKPVTTFGLPWYAGWGLTDDRHTMLNKISQRRQQQLTGSATVLDLFAAAYLRYCRYIDPHSGELTSIFTVIDYLATARAFNAKRNRTLYSPKLTLWKKTIVKPFLKGRNNRLCFSLPKKNTLENTPAALVVWGVKGEQRWHATATALNIPQWRMEDGFLRSVGLGCELHRPLSLVLDTRGIYYDATRSSDLEHLLQHASPSEYQRQQADHLMAELIKRKLSKYNVGKTALTLPIITQDKIILVPGQVEDDASVMRGSPNIRTNQALLEQVKKSHPTAFIIYKPHPDVLTGNRKGDVDNKTLQSCADYIADNINIIDCIIAVDEVHTMTSQCGFEALLHGKKVVCYGMPFYAGWGLTEDKIACQRRTKTHNLTTLVWATLIAYPDYIHPTSGKLLTAEQAMHYLTAQKEHVARAGLQQGFIARQWRKTKALTSTLLFS